MKILNKLTNGMILIFIGIMHTQLVISSAGCGNQFWKFSTSYFFRICNGMEELPAITGKTNFETIAVFWFFYFGIFLIPLGLLVHAIERDRRILPNSFTISYLIFVLIGSYMIPDSGMTYFMLPHALYMLFRNFIIIKRRKLNY